MKSFVSNDLRMVLNAGEKLAVIIHLVRVWQCRLIYPHWNRKGCSLCLNLVSMYLKQLYTPYALLSLYWTSSPV